jgi:hypothetical protein
MSKLLLSIIVLIFFGSCSDSDHLAQTESEAISPIVDINIRDSEYNFERNAYFGDVHVHSMYSYDAFIFGGIASPNEAYEFAKGGSVRHPAGFDMQLDSPMDFYAVSDHAYYLGIIKEMASGDSDLSQHPVAEGLDNLGDDVSFRRSVFRRFADFASAGNGGEIMDDTVVKNAWDDIVASANRHNDPGRFTAFIAYEYTGTGPEEEVLHRNVIFRDGIAPELPFSRINSDDPQDLWSWMDSNRANGIESLAIPHNSNVSDGLMFALTDYAGRPLDSAYANQRVRNEPLVEITQVKGTSETNPALSPNDELAGFEILPFKIGGDIPIKPEGSYVRKALLDGIKLESENGFNPFKFGIIGSSDNHNATAVGTEDNFYGASGLLDSDGQKRGSLPLNSSENNSNVYFDRYSRFGASGLAGVWAEENTRESIYGAMRRKETFGTSGPRLKVRFFAGHDLPPINDTELIAKSYSNGVAMGGDLIAEDAQSVSFIAWAAKDPNSAPLQRLQIIKGWVEAGEAHEKVYDVACADGLQVDSITHRCPSNGASVDLADCSISSGVGAAELKTRWEDPDYDATQHVFYYVRAIENPTCRWSTWDAIRAGVAPRDDVPATIQERGWSSPIWVNPE